jgi:hypothetical protein
VSGTQILSADCRSGKGLFRHFAGFLAKRKTPVFSGAITPAAAGVPHAIHSARSGQLHRRDRGVISVLCLDKSGNGLPACESLTANQNRLQLASAHTRQSPPVQSGQAYAPARESTACCSQGEKIFNVGIDHQSCS